MLTGGRGGPSHVNVSKELPMPMQQIMGFYPSKIVELWHSGVSRQFSNSVLNFTFILFPFLSLVKVTIKLFVVQGKKGISICSLRNETISDNTVKWI